MGNIEEYNNMKNAGIGDIIGYTFEYYDETAKAKILETLYRQNYNYKSIGKEKKKGIIAKIETACKEGAFGEFYKSIFNDGYVTTMTIYNKDYLFFLNLKDKETNFSGFVKEVNLQSDIVNSKNYIEEIALDNMVNAFMKENCISSIRLGMDKNNKPYYMIATNKFRMKNLSEDERAEISALNGKKFASIDELIDFISAYSSSVNAGL